MTEHDPFLPHDLSPLDNAALRDPLMIEMKDTHSDVQKMHPLLDLVKQPLDAEETDLIEKLFSLLTETTEELRLNREARSAQQEDAADMRAEIAALGDITTEQANMIRDMHRLLMAPLPAP